jgi:hypothetical protein
LSTGEEGALMGFWEAMDPGAREQFMAAVAPLIPALRAFGLGRGVAAVPPPSHARTPAGANAPVANRLAATMENAAANRKPTSAEQRAILDLARTYDLFASEWDEGKWR